MDKKQTILDIIKKKRIILDGGTGTVLQKMGLKSGTPPERWTFDHPEKIEKLHLEYLRCGSDVIVTNTFGVNSLKYENYEEYISAAVAIARSAREKYYAEGGEGDKFVALDIGPSGKMLKPLGDLDFEDAVELFARSIRVGASAGVDLVYIETMNDSYETKAAVLAAKENSDLPIFVTNVYDESCKLMTGATPEAMVAMLEGLGVSALGANCSLGPDRLMPTVKRLLAAASVPVIVKPNAGLPIIRDGESVFDVTAEEFCGYMAEMAALGASALGGCCGTTPDYIRTMRDAVFSVPYSYPERKGITLISSYTHAVRVGKRPLLIGERINPTGKPRLKEALRTSDMSYILTEALKEEEAGCDALDVNVGLPEIDEPSMMRRAISELQAVTDLPLQIDTGDRRALEAAMRIYNGKPLVNSVNGKSESMNTVLPLVKKYGGALIALTMDESGIPDTVAGRVAIAERIAQEAEKYGIDKKELIFDPLAMAVSSDKCAARVTLQTLSELTKRGYYTSLGVSNVSFGLPAREKINCAYFVMAMEAGLSMAIINPHSSAMLDSYHAYLALSGKDESFTRYIAYADGAKENKPTAAQTPSTEMTLREAIVSGLRDISERLAREKTKDTPPTEIIDSEVIPALKRVGADFESGKIYLPSLLMSAEAAKVAFEEIKKALPKNAEKGEKIILATVKGDIHDIGKNIVKTLLESHGYAVIDLGKDVSAEAVLAAARESGARLVGLSALMTTTVPAMEETVRLIHGELPTVKVMVGGAVLTADYADSMGADFYAADAVGAVKIAEAVFG